MDKSMGDQQATASWLRAVGGALHPARLGLCLVGMGLTVVVGAAAGAVGAGSGFRLTDWWHDPVAEGQNLGGRLLSGGPAGTVVGGALLAALLSLIWSLIEGWIARAEFLQQRALDEAGSTGNAWPISPNQILYRRAKPLCPLLPTILILTRLTLLPRL